MGFTIGTCVTHVTVTHIIVIHRWSSNVSKDHFFLSQTCREGGREGGRVGSKRPFNASDRKQKGKRNVKNVQMTDRISIIGSSSNFGLKKTLPQNHSPCHPYLPRAHADDALGRKDPGVGGGRDLGHGAVVGHRAGNHDDERERKTEAGSVPAAAAYTDRDGSGHLSDEEQCRRRPPTPRTTKAVKYG
jgi:hypothetical protein